MAKGKGKRAERAAQQSSSGAQAAITFLVTVSAGRMSPAECGVFLCGPALSVESSGALAVGADLTDLASMRAELTASKAAVSALESVLAKTNRLQQATEGEMKQLRKERDEARAEADALRKALADGAALVSGVVSYAKANGTPAANVVLSTAQGAVDSTDTVDKWRGASKAATPEVTQAAQAAPAARVAKSRKVKDKSSPAAPPAAPAPAPSAVKAPRMTLEALAAQAAMRTAADAIKAHERIPASAPAVTVVPSTDRTRGPVTAPTAPPVGPALMETEVPPASERIERWLSAIQAGTAKLADVREKDTGRVAGEVTYRMMNWASEQSAKKKAGAAAPAVKVAAQAAPAPAVAVKAAPAVKASRITASKSDMVDTGAAPALSDERINEILGSMLLPALLLLAKSAGIKGARKMGIDTLRTALSKDATACVILDGQEAAKEADRKAIRESKRPASTPDVKANVSTKRERKANARAAYMTRFGKAAPKTWGTLKLLSAVSTGVASKR